MAQFIFKPSAKEMREHLNKVRKALVEGGSGSGVGGSLKNSWTKVSIWLDRWVQKNFKSEGGSVGGWKKSQRAIRQGGMTLQDKGRLRSSYVPFATNTTAGIGSGLHYAADHEEGLHGSLECRQATSGRLEKYRQRCLHPWIPCDPWIGAAVGLLSILLQANLSLFGL